MSKINMENMNVAPLRKDVEDNSEAIIKIVNEIIGPYCKDLDNYVSFIRGILQDGNNAPTNDELDDFCMNLSTLIYFASGMCEQLGIRDDISRAIYKEAYHSARSKYDKGTVADKNSLAELEVQHEEVVNIAYSRSYKILKAKIDSAQELLASCKKILGRRITEMELTRLQR